MVFHAELDKKGSVVLENLKFETVIEKGIYIYGCTKAILKYIQIKEGRNCIYYCGLSLERIDDISIRNLDLRDSHQALSISQSKGLIEDSKIVRNTRPVLFTANGGGLQASKAHCPSPIPKGILASLVRFYVLYLLVERVEDFGILLKL